MAVKEVNALSIEVAESLKEALWKVEKDRDVEPMIQVLSEDREVGNVAVPQTFRGHDGVREFWTAYRKTFDDMESTFRNVFADDAGHAALEGRTAGTSDGDSVSYAGVSVLEIEGDKVRRFIAYMAYFDSSTLSRQVVK